MLIVIVAALLGLWRFRSFDYFKWIAITTVWMFLGSFLFAGGGTLEDPTGDGLVAHQIRVATNDGVGMGLFAIVFLVVYWGGVIFFISKMVKAAKAVGQNAEAAFSDDNYVPPADNTYRKVLETFVLLVVTAAWGWFTFFQPATESYAPVSSQSAEPLPSPTSLSIEQEVMGAAAEINSNTPQVIDDVTILQRASASGSTLTYHYKVEASSADHEALLTFIRTNVVPKACTGELRQTMRVDGVSYTFSYVGTDFTTPVETTVDETMCASLEG